MPGPETFEKKSQHIITIAKKRADGETNTKIIDLKNILPPHDVETLIKEIKSPDGKKLSDTLDIPSLKEQLQKIRELPGSSTEAISQEERRIANTIQDEVSKIPYDDNTSSPDEILETGYSNCVGISILGGAYLRKAGLNYLVVDLIDHSTILQVLNNGQVVWRDMQNPSSKSINLTNEMIKNQRSDGKTLNVADIVKFSKNPRTEGLTFNLKIDQDQSPKGDNIVIFAPEVGHKLQSLEILGIYLAELGHPDDAIKAFRETIEINSMHARTHYNLANSLAELNRHDEAIKEFKESIEINPDDPDAHHNLGTSLDALGRHDEATEAYENAISKTDKDKGYSWTTPTKI